VKFLSDTLHLALEELRKEREHNQRIMKDLYKQILEIKAGQEKEQHRIVTWKVESYNIMQDILSHVKGKKQEDGQSQPDHADSSKAQKKQAKTHPDLQKTKDQEKNKSKPGEGSQELQSNSGIPGDDPIGSSVEQKKKTGDPEKSEAKTEVPGEMPKDQKDGKQTGSQDSKTEWVDAWGKENKKEIKMVFRFRVLSCFLFS